VRIIDEYKDFRCCSILPLKTNIKILDYSNPLVCILLLDSNVVKSHTTGMTKADKVTSMRLIIAPIFFVIYFIPSWFSLKDGWTVPILWILFITAELTDLIDGKLARSRKEVSDFGKLFDPFADTLERITYFFCFVLDGILPSFLLLIILYREFGILFLRALLMKQGVVLGARSGGKAKAVTYMLTGVLSLIAISINRLQLYITWFNKVKVAAAVVFCIAVVLSLISFFDYIRVYKKTIHDS
jgi:CDP-diacylglycerol--glycerol-3-phosphate 3-phosphatidyltransferase